MSVLLALLLAAAPQKTETIFNGRDLTGWEGNPAVWSVRDGALTGASPKDPADPTKSALRHNTFLIWKGGALRDFELTLRYRIEGGNSGVQYRSKVVEQGPDGPIVQGYQADIDSGTAFTGSLYDERGRGTLADRGQRITLTPAGERLPTGNPVGDRDDLQKAVRTGDWNDYRIVAKGNRLQHFVNGRQTVDVTDENPAAYASGILALQLHAGPAMVVQFKAIRLRKTSPP